MRARETARRVLEEYHRKARQMGRNIDTVTRRGNGREKRRGEKRGEKRGTTRGAEDLRDSLVYMRLHMTMVYNDGGG